MPAAQLKADLPDDVRDRVTKIMDDALVWDNHAGFAFVKADDLVELDRWRQSGVDYVSVNIGYDVVPWTKAVEAVSKYRHWIRAHGDQYVQVETYDDVLRAKNDGKLAVAFDLEGANALNGDPGMVDFYYRLGVRQMLFAYNRNNLAGGGCHDEDIGLTSFGRDVLREMNRVGMVVDCSHCSYRTSMEAMDRSESPVIFSHSNARNLFDHERNIRDEQVKACAGRDGVIGVTGVGLFLGKNGADPRHVLEHIDYLCQLVGPRHVGIGMDSVLNHQGDEDVGEVATFYWPARQYPSGLQLTGSQGFVPPETFPGLVQGMSDLGYNDDDIAGILGGNFARLARQVWKPV